MTPRKELTKRQAQAELRKVFPAIVDFLEDQGDGDARNHPYFQYARIGRRILRGLKWRQRWAK